MTCKYCGNELREDAKFCPHCGRVNGSEPEPASSGTRPAPAWEGPEGGGTRKKAGLIVGAAVAAVAVIALLVVVVSGMFASPKAQVEKAAIQSAAAYVQAKKALGLPDLSGLREEQSVSQLVSLELSGLDTDLLGYDLSPLEELSVAISTDLDVKNRTMGMELSAFWDAQELLQLQLAADGAELYLASPQFTNGTFYGVNTETLGEDLREMGNQDAGDISFNLFDLMEPFLDTDRYEEAEQAIRQANKALWEAAEVKKDGREKISVNQAETDATVYRVTVPQEALDDYIDAVVPVLLMHYLGFYEEAVLSLGVPIGDVDGIPVFPGLTYSNLIDALHYAVEEQGDLELAVYVGDGYISAVVYENRLDGGRGALLRLALYLGGGKEYVDNLRLEIEADGQTVTIDSAGDHGCKTGTFTDKTTVRGPFTAVTSQLQYIPGAFVPEGNLSWTVSAPGAGSLEVEGDLQGGEDSLELHLERIGIKVLGLELATLKGDYQVGPCAGPRYSLDNAQLVPEMEGLALVRAYVTVGANIQTWTQDMQKLFAARLPQELLDALL